MYLQGLPSGFDIMYPALADRNMQVRFGLKGILSSGCLTYDPLIWLKVTSLSSTASVFRDGKISLKFQKSTKKYFFLKTSQWDDLPVRFVFMNLSGFKKYIGLNDLNSLFGLKKSKTAYSVHTEWFSWHQKLIGLNDLNCISGLNASFHQIN